jgi:dihydroorotase
MHPPTLLIQSAQVVRDSRPPEPADVLICDGRIAEIGAEISPPQGARLIPAAGKVLLPGLFDSHAHIREPGREDAETLASAAQAAVRGGITGFVCMPDASPPIDNGGMVQSVLDLSSRTVLSGHICVAGCITKGGRGEELAEIGDMHDRGAVMITDDPDAVGNPLLMRRALQYARDLGLPVGTHCEIQELSGAGSINDGRMSYRLGLPGIPACSEEICLARDIRLAQSVNTSLHVNLVSTRRGVETIARYKKEGMPVTAGVTPHHLIFCDSDVGDYDTNFKVKPPLRTTADREALIDGLRDGTLDIIVTDHDPHTEFEKEREFSGAPFGITGLETALLAIHHHLILPGKLDWQILVERFSKAPRRLARRPVAAIEPGQPANLVLFDPQGTTQVRADSLASRSLNTPFLGRDLQGKICLVVLGTNILRES